MPSVYGLDTSDVAKWGEDVEQPAYEIIESFLNKTDCKHKPLPLKDPMQATSPCSEDDTYFCEICDRVFVGNFQWMEHKKSKKHKKMVVKRNKEKELLRLQDEVESQTKSNENEKNERGEVEDTKGTN